MTIRLRGIYVVCVASAMFAAVLARPVLAQGAGDKPGDTNPPAEPDASAQPKADAPPDSPASPPAGASASPPSEPATKAADAAAPAQSGAAKAAAPDAKTAPKREPKAGDQPHDAPHQGSFEFGSYGRIVAAANGEGDRGADADIVQHGSRLDEDNYAEIELRREDDWEATGVHTDVVFTLAIASPVFHYSGDFDVALAVRNLYLEAKDLGVPGLGAWAGSRMVRGDDIYVLDFWPLDNLNLLGAGVGYKHPIGTGARLAVGATQPNSDFFNQKVFRPAPLDQFGAVPVELLDRQKLIGSLRVEHDQRFGPRDTTKAGIKGVLYGEGHALPVG
ncbi:MAG TPA: carbohydrate porin [Polyangiaceae bacterium]|nr:carbohydrate porin [Polyangiaceae bacterium]